MVAPARSVVLSGRILFLTEDAELLRGQLCGRDLDFDPERALLSNVSTDEIAPGWACYYYDETLARYCLVGLRGGSVPRDAIQGGGFSVIVSGASKGCGSSRETAPFSELAAGVRLVIARSIEKIYRQNADNIGLLTSTDFGLIPRIRRGESIPIEEFTKGRDAISASIVVSGGLFAYSRERLAGRVATIGIGTMPRPMTLVEKILARHIVFDADVERREVIAVKPGDGVFVRTDIRFSHDYVTAMAESLFRRGFGGDARVEEPSSVFAFRDHLTFLDLVMPQAQRAIGLDHRARELARVQEVFAERVGARLYGEVVRDGVVAGSEGICHNLVIEDIALPGQVVVGTDSHTCMAGALGCVAFGVGSTDMANAWKTRDVRVTVPETVRFLLKGSMRYGVCAKDLMLFLLSQPFFKSSQGIGRVLEFGGPAIASLPIDERSTLTNMAVEAGGFTGIIEADEVVVSYLAAQRGLSPDEIRRRIVRADPEAQYVATFEVDLDTLRPMVALPGDPRNGVPLTELDRDVKVDIAYGGSCTGGKKADMDMYAGVLASALSTGKRVAPGVDFYVQFGSEAIRRHAEERGYLAVFARAGAQVLGPSCGACIKAGPGSSERSEQVTISAQNRNFPGRSGPGQVYLASPFVVAASAVCGRIASPAEI
ncbi:MAG: aconitase family protein [Polyangiaceae bacterium]